ncbi:MAG: hypothetical protein ACREN6_03800 [Gemmatimonadaceae bacterium]
MPPIRSIARAAFTLACFTLAPAVAPAVAAAQSTGFVHLRTYFAGGASTDDYGVYRTFEQGPSGLVETFTEEYTPGTHTLAVVETHYGNCRAAANNVTFTIKAGQWTEVPVQVAWVDCSIAIAFNAFGGYGTGFGTVEFAALATIGPSIAVASCTTFAGSGGIIRWTNFHQCQGTVPYGATVASTETPDATSCCADTDSFVVDTNTTPYEYRWGFGDAASPAPEQSYATDVGISLVGGSFGGQRSTHIFRVVNHGTKIAQGVQVNVAYDGDAPENYGTNISITDGYCSNIMVECTLAYLPAGDSTTVTVRYYGVPKIRNDTTPRNFPTVTPGCTVVSVSTYGNSDVGDPANPDPNPSNNTANCLTGVPIAAALGGSTPLNATVQKGSTDVPMLEFVLNPATPQTLNSVTLAASGSGNEQVDVTAVNLYNDANGNGKVDAGETLLATGTFPSNDGTVTLNVAPPLAISGPTNLLVTYSFGETIAQRMGKGLTLAVFPLLLLPAAFKRRKRWTAVLLLAASGVILSSCSRDSTAPSGVGDGGSGGSVTYTFQSTLTGVSTSGGSASNLAVHGATITVAK